MKFDTVFAVRLSSIEDSKVVERINRYEGKTGSEKLRNFLRNAVMEEGQ